MPQEKRLFQFNGTNDDYIKFLEDKVESLQKEVIRLGRQLSPIPRSRRTLPSHRNPTSVHPESQKRIANPTIQNNDAFSSRLAGVMSNFLGLLPTLASQWRERRQSTSLVTPEQVMQTFQTLTRLSSPAVSTLRSHHSPDISPINILNDYCMFARYLKQQAEHQTQLSRYATLLFLGICCVAKEAGVKVGDIDSCIKTYLGKTEYSSVYCRRLRAASKWCAQLTEKLEDVIGGYGSELFLLYGQDMAVYQKLSESSKCLDDALQKIIETLSFLRKDAIEEPVIFFSMPFMLTFMGLNLKCVNKALGTDLSVENYTLRARMVEDLANYNYGGQQGTAALGINHDSDRLAMLIQAAQSSNPNGNGRGLIAEASITEFTDSEGNNGGWTGFIGWGSNTSEMDVFLAGDSPTGVL